MAGDQDASDRSARPLPECLTQLLEPPRGTPGAPSDDRKPSLFDRVLWWLSVAMFGAVSLVFGAALKIAGLWP